MKSIDIIIYRFFSVWQTANDKRQILNTDQGHFPSKLNLKYMRVNENPCKAIYYSLKPYIFFWVFFCHCHAFSFFLSFSNRVYYQQINNHTYFKNYRYNHIVNIALYNATMKCNAASPKAAIESIRSACKRKKETFVAPTYNRTYMHICVSTYTLYMYDCACKGLIMMVSIFVNIYGCTRRTLMIFSETNYQLFSVHIAKPIELRQSHTYCV